MKKLLRVGTAALCAAALLSTSAFADGITHSISYDYSGNKAYVTGIAPEGTKYVLMQVLKKGKSFDDLQADALVYSTDSILWNGQATVADDGGFSFDVGVISDLEVGYYDAYFSSELVNSTVQLTGTDGLLLLGRTVYQDAVAALNTAADAENLTEFAAAIKGSGISPLGFDAALIAEKGDSITRKYMGYVKNNHLDPNKSRDNEKMFNTYMIMAALEGAFTDNITEKLEKSSLKDSDTFAYFDRVVDSVDEERYVTGKLLRKSFADQADLEDEIKKALVLNQARYADGFGDVKEAVGKYAALLGITPTDKTAVYRSLVGVDFTDINAFVKRYNELANPGGVVSGGGGRPGNTGNTGTTVSGTYEPLPSENESVGKITVSFVDIEDIDWAVEAIIALADKGIVNGRGDGYFMPDDFVTREEFAKILVEALGFGGSLNNSNVFSDAAESDWFCKYINTAFEKGLVKGIGDGLFGVGQNITRQDMVVMTYNALKIRNAALPEGELTFDDAGSIADYARSAVAALSGLGIVNGVSETSFDPLGTATRAQAAKIVYGILLQLQ